MATISFPRKLNTLNDVDLSAEADKDLLVYNTSTGQWSNSKTVSELTSSVGFSGNGSQLTNLTASNIDNFTSDVRKQLSAGSGLNYDSVNGVFSLGSGTGTDISTGATTSLTASSEFFIACSGSSTGSVIDVRLPLISDIGNGKNYVIKNVGIGTVNIRCSGSNLIDGQVSASIYTTYSSYSIFGTGSNWWVY